MTRFDLGTTWLYRGVVRMAFISGRLMDHMVKHHPYDFYQVEGWKDVGDFTPIGATRHGERRIYFIKKF